MIRRQVCCSGGGDAGQKRVQRIKWIKRIQWIHQTQICRQDKWSGLGGTLGVEEQQTGKRCKIILAARHLTVTADPGKGRGCFYK